MNSFRRKLIIGILILALLSPLGLILPSFFKSKESFGEASPDSLKKELGYIPAGMKKHEKVWKAPVKDYELGSTQKPLWLKSIIYLGSGLIGIGIIAAGTFWLQKIYRKDE